MDTLKEVGKILEQKGLVSFRDGKFVQNGANCFSVASEVAKLFGCETVQLSEFRRLYTNYRLNKMYEDGELPHEIKLIKTLKELFNQSSVTED